MEEAVAAFAMQGDAASLVKLVVLKEQGDEGLPSNDAQRKEEYIRKLSEYTTALRSILLKYETLGTDVAPKSPEGIKSKAFIAHGGKSGVLDKLREFIQALGIDPLIVELLPTKGMSVDDKVKKYIHEADCGIVLATRGGIIDKKSEKQH